MKQIKTSKQFHLVVRTPTVSLEDETKTKEVTDRLLEMLANGFQFETGVRRKTILKVPKALRYISGEDRGKTEHKYHVHIHVVLSDIYEQTTFRRNLQKALGYQHLQCGVVRDENKSEVYALKGKCYKMHGYTDVRLKEIEGKWNTPTGRSDSFTIRNNRIKEIALGLKMKDYKNSLIKAIAIYYRENKKTFDYYYMKKLLHTLLNLEQDDASYLEAMGYDEVAEENFEYDD